MIIANIQRIIDDLNDLGIEYSDAAKEAISAFYKKHAHKDLSANQLLYIIHGLGTLHTLTTAASQLSRIADELLNLIYSQSKLCSEELSLISDSLFEFHSSKKISRRTTNSLSDYAERSIWINNFLAYMQRLIYPSKMYQYADADPIISMNPTAKSSSADLKTYGFAYHEIMGLRKTQEDAVIWSPLDEIVLEGLSKEQVGFCMWTAYRNLDDSLLSKTSGTTASTTICTKDNLVTATLADTIAFALIYKNDGKIWVRRLNKRIRHAEDPDETQRIIAAGGFVADNRVLGQLSPPRAIGDRMYTGVCAEADIDVFDLNQFTDVAKIQVLTACDGFTEPLVYEEERPDTKENCEEFLSRYLNMVSSQAGKLLINMSEHEICELLVTAALNNGSEDNISICIQTVKQGPHYFIGMHGIYDGHDGYTASHHVASNIVDEIKRLIRLTPDEYARETNSAIANNEAYDRDNTKTQASTRYLPPPGL